MRACVRSILAMLEVRALSAGYGRSRVLFDVALEVGAGEVAALVGRNGAGKSTLLKAVMGLLAPSAGEVRFEGRRIDRMATEDIDLGLRMNQLGWYGAYVPEILVKGYAPPSMDSYVTQQYRWANGNMAILREYGVSELRIVEKAGEPTLHMQWVEPEQDPVLKKAIRENRVMSVHQSNTGTTRDFGTLGYIKDRLSQVLIFPKSLRRFADRRVVGIKYDLLAKDTTHVYVCGLRGMEPGVMEGLQKAAASQGVDWTEFHAQLKAENRWHVEVY